MGKKNKEGVSQKIKKVFSYLKRASKPKQPKKEKIKKPKSYMFRKMGAISFWILFTFMLLFVFVNMFSSSPASVAKEDDDEEISLTSQPEAIQFAKDFARHYFSWDMDDMEKREENISKYLAAGMDAQAGLKTTGMGWNSTFNGATLKRVEEVAENKSNIVLYIRSTIAREVESDDKKDNKSETEEKELYKYFVVPVAYDGESLGVYSAPYFTNVDEENDTQINNKSLTKGLKRPDSSGEERNIQNFLDIFFTSYAEDAPDKLSYIMNDSETVGLDGEMEFINVKKSDVYQADTDNTFIVYAEVTFAEPDTDIEFDASHYMLVSKENDQYVVEQMNAEEYIQDMTGNSVFKEVEEDAADGDADNNEDEKELEEDDANEEVEQNNE